MWRNVPRDSPLLFALASVKSFRHLGSLIFSSGSCFVSSFSSFGEPCWILDLCEAEDERGVMLIFLSSPFSPSLSLRAPASPSLGSIGSPGLETGLLLCFAKFPAAFFAPEADAVRFELGKFSLACFMEALPPEFEGVLEVEDMEASEEYVVWN